MIWLLLPYPRKLEWRHTRDWEEGHLADWRGGGLGEEPNHTTERKPGPLWLIQYSLTSLHLMEGHNWFQKKFVKIPRRSIIVCFLSLSAKAGSNLSPLEISWAWPQSRICPSICNRFWYAVTIDWTVKGLCGRCLSWSIDWRYSTVSRVGIFRTRFVNCCGLPH